MLIVRITDGLGNQLFQYCFGRFIAELTGQNLLLDSRTFYEHLIPQHLKGSRKYLLDRYAIKAKEASASQIFRLTRSLPFLPDWWRHKIQRAFQKVGMGPSVFEQFDPSMLELIAPDSDLYLTGWWQSYKYCQALESDIRNELSLRSPPEGQHAEIAHRIANCNSVSIHVRRGDYASADYYLLPPAYYRNAMQFVSQHVDEPHYFVFSDEPDSCKPMFDGMPNVELLANNANADPCEELRLMSLCKSNIVANSTFSWWGAWLNTKHDKLVIAPTLWKTPQHSLDATLPDNWKRIDVE